MRTQLESWDASQILQPVQAPGDARQDAMAFGPNLTIAAGQSVAVKTSDKKGYAFNPANSDGTEKWVGFSMYPFKTDADGLIYYGGSTTPSTRNGPFSTTAIWKGGIFDPADVTTKPTPLGAVYTFTPANVEVDDVFTITYTGPGQQTIAISFTATATTAANVAAGLIALWNANPVLAAVATASGSSTIILTGTTVGLDFTAVATTTDGGGTNNQTLTRATTTAAAGRAIADIQTSVPAARVLQNGYWHIPA